MSSFISAFADAITRQEGYFPGSRAWANNNPGNIWDGVNSTKTKRIWPNLPIDAQGFVIYPTAAAGRAALERDLTAKMNAGLTLDSAVAMYAPPAENQTGVYQAHMADWLGVDGSARLSDLSASWNGAADAAFTAALTVANVGRVFAQIDIRAARDHADKWGEEFCEVVLQRLAAIARRGATQ